MSVVALSPRPGTVTGMDTTRTVPTIAAQLLLGGTVLPDGAVVGRRVGDNVEVDLDAVAAQLDSETADALDSFYTACRALWSDRSRDTEVVHTRRVLHQGHLIERRDVKHYLDDEIAAFAADPLLTELHRLLLSRYDPQVAAAQRLLAAAGGQLHEDVNGRGTRQVSVQAPLVATGTTPDALGGPVGPGEMRRTVQFTVRYARSADRAARRLTTLAVYADELFPDPGGYLPA